MARSSAEDMELRKSCAVAIAGSGGKEEEIVLSIRVAKGRGIFEKLGRLAEPRVLAVTTKHSARSEKTKAFIRVLKYSSGAGLEPAKLYKLKHLTKLEVVTNDPSGCTFFMGFDNLRSQSVAPPQWTMRNIDDRNRLLFCILNLCKEILARLPKVNGIDIVELALWAKDNTPAVITTQVTTTQESNQDGATVTVVKEREVQVVSVEKDLLVSHAEEEEEDMESMKSLLSMYLMGIGETEAFSERMKQELLALEATNVYSLLEAEPLLDEVVKGLDAATLYIDDIDEWLQIFNVKLRHMREDIASIESRNNTMELLSDNCKGLVDELDRLLNKLRIPPEYSAILTTGSFEEKRMLKHVEACEWLSAALHSLQASNMEPCYANMRAVRERHEELEKLKAIFVKRATEFLTNYFSTLADFMLTDKSYFAQFRGQLKRPDHADLRFKCRTYARLLQHLKSLDRSSLVPLRKAYCQSLNLLLRREAREFSNELRSSTKIPRNPPGWLEGSSNSNDTSMVSEAYSNMLKIFIPLLVDESSFFAHFMCFEGIDNKDDDDDLEIMDPDGNDDKPEITSSELGALNEALKDLLDGIQEDFYAIIDWAWKVDPLRCISMYGLTERYLSGQKTDAAGFVRKLLDDLRSKIISQFNKFIDEVCHQIERNERNVRPPIGVLSYMTKFENLASRMEHNIQGQSRDMVDKAYSKLVGAMFNTLEKIAETDSKSFDIVLIENYAAFQNSLYELANAVSSLAKFYHLASESYEQACTRLCNSVINLQFDKLISFHQKVDELRLRCGKSNEEIPFQQGLSKSDLRKVLKYSLTGIDRSFNLMYKKLVKSLTTEELLPSIWIKCKKEFLDKYAAFVEMVLKIYGNEPVTPVAEIKELIASL
ncbi:Exocyst complex component SEC3A [Rhynchospora pubera]|uniref:Exocyst complex component SEC3A n=2 Tax=Rhynchospora pubera TaxID=906938 RepID=A0AAV8F4W8_9POAL|nr:Exocyst complex component SEC3A [Rhynchospora pubera]